MVFSGHPWFRRILSLNCIAQAGTTEEDAGAALAGVDRVVAAGEARQRRLYHSRPEAISAASSPISIFPGQVVDQGGGLSETLCTMP